MLVGWNRSFQLWYSVVPLPSGRLWISPAAEYPTMEAYVVCCAPSVPETAVTWLSEFAAGFLLPWKTKLDGLKNRLEDSEIPVQIFVPCA